MGLVNRKIEGDKVICLYESSNIVLSEYEMSKQLLDITFKNGIKYRYYHVNTQDHAGLQIAESTGKYFNQTIKSHSFEKVGKVILEEEIKKVKK